jgi:hypothetical protein
MKTTKLVLSLAAAALVVSAAAPAADDGSPTNPLHPAFYWNTSGSKLTVIPMSDNAAVKPTNPLHPAFYANKLDNVTWLATRASASMAMRVDEIRNPLHPQYKR